GQPPAEEHAEGHVQPAHVTGAGVDEAVRLGGPEHCDLPLADRQRLTPEQVMQLPVEHDIDLDVVMAVHRDHRRRSAPADPEPRVHLLDDVIERPLGHRLTVAQQWPHPSKDPGTFANETGRPPAAYAPSVKT